MSTKPMLYGYSPSTYVRTARMVLADHNVDYDQVEINVLGGETHLPDHIARHPFGKVPVLDIDGMRLRETNAICRYIHETRSGTSSIPEDAKQRAKMNEAISVYDSYGYVAMLKIAAYHLFPDFIGGPNDEILAQAHTDTEKVMSLLMEQSGPWILGDAPSLADYFLAPVIFYVAMTPEMARIQELPGVAAWWEAMNGHATYKATEPVLG